VKSFVDNCVTYEASFVGQDTLELITSFVSSSISFSSSCDIQNNKQGHVSLDFIYYHWCWTL